MANSGIDEVEINLLERALSADVNQLQANISTAMMEILRYQYGYDRRNPGVGTPNNINYEKPADAAQTPSMGTRVLGGLLVNPQPAALLVDPGALLTLNAAPDPDESSFTFANSEGVTNAAQFPFVANGGAGPRWDILECRPVVSTTNSSRDIFDPVTQQFAAQSVPKFRSTTLEFQYTQGTAASPSPAPSATAGWQPLCLVWVPVGAGSFDDCELFDVRPILGQLLDPAGFNNQNGNTEKDNFSVHTTWQAKNGTNGGVGTLSNDASVVGRVWIRDQIQDQFDLSDPYVNGPNYTEFGRKGYSASFSLQDTSPGATNIGVHPRPFRGSNVPGDTPETYDGSGTLQTSQLCQFGIIMPFGFARFHKYANFTFEGRRWPIRMPGLFVVNPNVTGIPYLGFDGSGSGLPIAYDTVSAGYAVITLGFFQTASFFGEGPRFENGFNCNWDGWVHGLGGVTGNTLGAPTLSTNTATFDVASNNAFMGHKIRAAARVSIDDVAGESATVCSWEVFSGSKWAPDVNNRVPQYNNLTSSCAATGGGGDVDVSTSMVEFDLLNLNFSAGDTTTYEVRLAISGDGSPTFRVGGLTGIDIYAVNLKRLGF